MLITHLVLLLPLLIPTLGPDNKNLIRTRHQPYDPGHPTLCPDGGSQKGQEASKVVMYIYKLFRVSFSVPMKKGETPFCTTST